MTETNNSADVVAETREAKTGARRRHPAGKAAPTPTPAADNAAATTTKKSTPAKGTASTPTKAATAASGKSAKLRWQFPDGFENRDVTGQQAYSAGHSYAILPVEDQDGKYSAVVKPDDGEAVYLVEAGAHSKCYAACLAHHRGVTAQPA
ncbi:hypothetical protein BV508_16325 [Mycobacterium intermedium]|nr:hypothetical protein BV508_16325 [Mycobacterium intermedium]